MTKKHFIALADEIKAENAMRKYKVFQKRHLKALARFCYNMNPRFNQVRFEGYIAGTCGPNGGKISKPFEGSNDETIS